VTHIETVQAVENLDAMLEVQGIDVMFIGPTDLSVSMGHPGNPGHPEVQATIADCIKRIAAAGKAPGLMTTGVDQFAGYAELGARYITVNIGSLVANAMKLVVAGAKS
jgi:4-hydroxy-2-oxoheptanedioate aldolase